MLPIMLYGQIGASKADIIRDKGSNYTLDYTTTGKPYLTYKESTSTSISGSYIKYTCYYISGGYCDEIMITEPLAEINSWVLYLNEHYVRESELTWKNYANNSLISITKDEHYVAVLFRNATR
jgi:hypothetical protein